MDLIKEKHQELISSLEELREIVDKMNEISNDGMLIWQKNEIIDWVSYLKEHTDVEELQSLEKEINDRFFFKYNVRIEPRDSDIVRLKTFEKVIHQFHSALH
ncbi:hypothetical protein [Paenibacillus sp. FSL K6-2524]|uniref:hypothetical protein n=1 Tax=Paenibacillus sp. FSL K6-2524 TaxID=2954516 RepID=UPI0030F84E5A